MAVVRCRISNWIQLIECERSSRFNQPNTNTCTHTHSSHSLTFSLFHPYVSNDCFSSGTHLCAHVLMYLCTRSCIDIELCAPPSPLVSLSWCSLCAICLWILWCMCVLFCKTCWIYSTPQNKICSLFSYMNKKKIPIVPYAQYTFLFSQSIFYVNLMKYF